MNKISHRLLDKRINSFLRNRNLIHLRIRLIRQPHQLNLILMNLNNLIQTIQNLKARVLVLSGFILKVKVLKDL